MSSEAFKMPPLMANDRGGIRHIGFEFEFAGVGLRACADLIQELFGGEVVMENRFSYKIKTPHGEFSAESDASLLKNRKYETYLKALGLDLSTLTIGKTVEDLIERATNDLVPFEIVTPPIELDDLDCVETLRRRLYEAGARGTHTHIFAAFGFQFNPELPALDAETLLSYMRAFLLLYPRLAQSEEIPLVRRVLPYIEPFPESYVKLVLNPDYAPSIEGFMNDYLAFNPTRNRPLDWLPLFCHINRDLVFNYDVEKDLIKPRPTLHYRLPSSLIDDPDWSVAKVWNKWIEVERLAANPDLLRKMSGEYLDLFNSFTLRAEHRWIERSAQWVQWPQDR